MRDRRRKARRAKMKSEGVLCSFFCMAVLVGRLQSRSGHAWRGVSIMACKDQRQILRKFARLIARLLRLSDIMAIFRDILVQLPPLPD